MENVPPPALTVNGNATPAIDRLPQYGRPYKPRVESKPPLPPMEQRMRDQKRNPERDAIEAQEKWPPAIVDTTRDTLAKSLVREYRALTKVIDDGGAVEPWQMTYRDIMEQVYREQANNGDLLNASDEQLLAAFRTGLNKDQYIPMALKIAEDQQEAIQRATGAHSRVAKRTFWGGKKHDIEKRKYVPLARASNAGGGNQYANDNMLGGGWWSRFNEDPLNYIFQDELTSRNKALKTEGKKSWRVIHGTVFPKDAKIDINATIGARGLTDVQKEYIRQMEQTGLTPNAAEIQMGAMREIDGTLHDIIDARMNVYASMDQVMTGDDLDLVRVTLNNNGGLQGMAMAPVSTREVSLNRYGFEGVTIVVGREADRATFLNEVTTRLKTKADEEAEKALKEKLTRPVLDDQIRVLERETQPRALTEDEITRRDAVSAEVATIQADTAVIDEFASRADSIKAKDEEVKNTKKGIPKEYATYTNPTNPDSLRAKEIAKRTADNDVTTFEAQVNRHRDELRTLQTDLSRADKAPALLVNVNTEHGQVVADLTAARANEAAIAAAGGNTSAAKREVDALNRREQELAKKRLDLMNDEATATALRARIGVVQGQLTAAETALTNRRNDVATLTDEIRDRNELINKYRPVADTLETQKRQLAELKALQTKVAKKLKDRGYDEKGTADEMRKRQQAEIKTRQDRIAEIEAAANPDKFKLRQLEVLRTFRDQISTPTADANIQNRVNQRANGIEVSRKLDAAALVYPGMDRSYLRTMQVLFSDRVTQDTTENRKLFESGYKMIPPSKFEEMVQDYCATRVPPLVAANFAPASVNPEFINYVIDRMHVDVRAGNLGKLEPAIEQRMRQIETVSATDINVERQELAKEQEDNLNKYQHELNERKANIKDFIETELNLVPPRTFADIATDLNDHFFEGSNVLTDTSVEALLTEARTIFADTINGLPDSATLTPAMKGNITAAIAAGRTFTDILGEPTFAPVAAEMQAAFEKSHESDRTMPNRTQVRELAEIVAANRKNESRRLFDMAIAQIVADPAVIADVRTALNQGMRVEAVLSMPVFAAHRTELQKAVHFSQSGDTLIAGLMYIMEPQDFEVFNRSLHQGKTIMESIQALPAPRRASVRRFVRESALSIAPPAVTLQEIEQNDAIGKAIKERAADRRPTLNAGGEDPVLTSMVDAAEAVEDKLQLDQLIAGYAERFPYSEDETDLTNRIVYDAGLQTDIAYAKMLAQEVIAYRKRNKPTVINMPAQPGVALAA